MKKWHPWNSCLVAAVGHRRVFLKKWNPSNLFGWVPLYIYSEKTYKIKMTLYAIFSKIFDGTQPGLNTFKSMGSKFEKYSSCTQLPEIYGFHF